MLLYLVRHAAVTLRPDQPGQHWYLSPEGRAGAESLAEEPYWAELRGIHTSPEPKAVATAQRIASRHGLPIRTERDLREVEGRTWVDIGYADQVHAYLSGDTPPGWERLKTARERVRGCIDSIVARHQSLKVGIVSHGLALTLYVIGTLGISSDDAIALWERIKFPDVAVFDPQTKRFEREFGGPSSR